MRFEEARGRVPPVPPFYDLAFLSNSHPRPKPMMAPIMQPSITAPTLMLAVFVLRSPPTTASATDH
jgi:hypothetical protein